ncbi:Pol polyprotein [Plakobranchus ocellatus]|uniref:Pol polyprotein n=1 Tax=Plakobranchus ocellatus TaxID=259542 RepID=A0AAV4B7N0_9GAST|nr:Pol polyprotein [Plakobranchus ocellatus]
MPNPTVKELDVSPALHVLNSQKSLFINNKISLHNTSNRTIRSVPGTQIAQMSPITVASMVDSESPVLPDIHRVYISPSERESLQELLNEWKDVFSQNDIDLGHYDGVKHKIDLTDEHPFKQRYRRIPPNMLEEVSDHLRQLEASGVIRPSKSPFSSPVVCCRKKDGRLRLCVNYRLLNSRTKKDNYCLPRVEEILDS